VARCLATTPSNAGPGQYLRVIGSVDVISEIARTGHQSLHSTDRPGQTRREAGTQSQGSPRETARLPIRECRTFIEKENNVKANLARFTWALTLLASLALTVGAGMRWN